MNTSPKVSAHTPGPWMIAGGLTIKAKGRHVATVGAKHLDRAEDQANAALIRAAPDLLNALEHAERHIMSEDPAIRFAVRETIRAAIAQAM